MAGSLLKVRKSCPGTCCLLCLSVWWLWCYFSRGHCCDIHLSFRCYKD
ncbi:hypothetical protein CIPAW_10G034900 [Carya illinoinensis]|uniref:Uncharacterized protein n=1 Tax=Carya illinoinensis TaxID=32201 RepID=A0A8T1PCP2_CARIL|nr:hypothetical protein CIPAW_10G034900 [Carya illinoinensis]